MEEAKTALADFHASHHPGQIGIGSCWILWRKEN